MAAQEQAANQAAEREARCLVCTGCGAKFTDERWSAIEAEGAGWNIVPEPHPSLCGTCDLRPGTDARGARPNIEQDQAAPEQKGTSWFSRLRG